MAKSNIKQQFAKFNRLCEDIAESQTKRVMLRLFSDISTETPVDEGVLRENWTIGEGSPRAIFRPARNKKATPGVAVEEASKWILSNGTAGKRMFISNATPYARRIEFGYSIQKPQGMVRVCVARLKRMIDSGAFGKMGATTK